MKFADSVSAICAISIALIFSLGSVSPVSAAAPYSSFVSVSGTKLLLDGKLFIPVGINHHDESSLWSASTTVPGNDVTAADWSAFRKLGFTSIRLSIKADYFKQPVGFLWLDRQLSLAKKNGLHVLLDMHIPPGGAQQDYQPSIANQRFWQSPELQEEFIKTWGAIARRYATSRVIWGFDLMNEPASRDVTQVGDLMRRTAGTIRAVDTHHALILEPVQQYDASGTESFVYPTLEDPSIVYSVHYYHPYGFTVQGVPWGISDETVIPRYPSASTTREDLWDAQRISDDLQLVGLSAARAAHVPAIIGEFGAVFHEKLRGQYFWIQDVTSAAQKAGTGWEYWVYKTRNLNGSFGLTGGNLQRKTILELLSSQAKAAQL